MAWLRKSPAERDARAQLCGATQRFKAAQSQQEADHAGADMDRAGDTLRAAQGKPPLPGRDEAYEEEPHRDDAEDEQAATDARLESNAMEIDAYNRGQQVSPSWAASPDGETFFAELEAADAAEFDAGAPDAHDFSPPTPAQQASFDAFWAAQAHGPDPQQVIRPPARRRSPDREAAD